MSGGWRPPKRTELDKIREQRDLLAVALRTMIRVYSEAGAEDQFCVALARLALKETRMEKRPDLDPACVREARR